MLTASAVAAQARASSAWAKQTWRMRGAEPAQLLRHGQAQVAGLAHAIEVLGDERVLAVVRGGAGRELGAELRGQGDEGVVARVNRAGSPARRDLGHRAFCDDHGVLTSCVPRPAACRAGVR